MAVADDFPDTRAVEGGDGQAGSHRFGEHQPLGFGLGGEDKTVHRRVGVGQGAAGLSSIHFKFRCSLTIKQPLRSLIAVCKKVRTGRTR